MTPDRLRKTGLIGTSGNIRHQFWQLVRLLQHRMINK